MREVHTTGRIRRGKLTVRSWERVQRQIAEMRDGEVVITVERAHATRTQQANRYYFGVVLKMIAEETGHSVIELHEDMRLRFLAKPLFYANKDTGELKVGAIPQSSSKLTVAEFYDFVDRVRHFAGEFLGLTIPDPDPLWWKKAA